MGGHDLDRPASPCSALWNAFDFRRAEVAKPNNPTTGRQGKSAASGRAQVVGWVETFWHSNIQAGWRFISKLERFQHLDRHRTLLKPVCAL
jgi:hypothetical protein